MSRLMYKNAYSKEAKTDFEGIYWMHFVFEYKVDIVVGIYNKRR